MCALDEANSREQRWELARLWARRFTLTLILVPALLAAPRFAACISHVLVDSEVGVMMYGLPLVIGIVLLWLMVFASTVTWGLGMRKTRLQGKEIPFWERWCFRGIAAGLALVFWGFSADYIYRGLRSIGL